MSELKANMVYRAVAVEAPPVEYTFAELKDLHTAEALHKRWTCGWEVADKAGTACFTVKDYPREVKLKGVLMVRYAYQRNVAGKWVRVKCTEYGWRF